MGHTKAEVITVSYVNPKIKSQFDSLSPELREMISSRHSRLDTLHDLIHALEEIVAEDEAGTAP